MDIHCLPRLQVVLRTLHPSIISILIMSDAANTIAIPSDYAWVACSVGLIGLVQFWLGGRAMGPRKHFKAANVLDNPKMKALQDEHKKLYGESVSLMVSRLCNDQSHGKDAYL